MSDESAGQLVTALGLDPGCGEDGDVLLSAMVALLERGSDYLVLLDESYVILAASRAFTEVVSPAGDLAGRNFLGLLDTGSHGKARAFLDREEGRSPPVELNLRGADGTVRLANFSFCRFVRPDGGRGVMAIGREQEQALRLVEQILRLNREVEASRAELERQAETDPLTGLGNRRWLFPKLDALWESAARQRRPAWVVMADVDHFKRVNDTYGHQAGDEVLMACAGALRGAVRRGDIVARYGGEEFVLAGPCRDVHELLGVTDRLLAAVRALRVEVPGATLRLTASLGAALAEPGPKNPPWVALQAADRAVYRAKAGGRDRCEIEPGIVSLSPRPRAEERRGAGCLSDAS